MQLKHRSKKKYLYLGLLGVAILAPLIGDIARRSNQVPVAAASTPSPTPIDPKDWGAFASALQERSSRFHGTVGYIVKDLKRGQLIEANASVVFPSASLIKLPILAVAFQAIQDHRLALSMPVTLRPQDRRGGSGILKWASPGTVMTIRDLLEDMIIYSDNTAAQVVVSLLGFDYLQNTFRQLGLQDTEIHPDGFRLTARRIADDNRTSPRDMALLLEKIYERELVSPEASEQMLVILKHQKLRDRLPRYLPPGWEIAHKTGLLRRACHDVGIVFAPGGDYLICVLTAHDAAYKTAKRFIASLGRITFDYYQGGFHRPVLQTRRSTSERAG